MSLRAVIYARVSSQTQRDRHTIASQLESLPRFVEAQGWKLVRPPKAYVDDGRTAKAGHLEQREAFGRLLADAALGVFDVVAVVDLDRLTRAEDMAERGAILGALQRAGVRVAIASTGQVLDLSSSMGDLYASLQAFFAAEENRKRRERTVRGKLEAIRQGRKPAGPTPFGYTYDRHSGEWGIHPVTGDVVREIFERVAAGESCLDIAQDLHERGIPRPRGLWTRERVWAIARATTYLGEWVADKRRGLTLPVPRIVSDELYQAAQDALQRKGRRGEKRARRTYLVQGIGRCGLCGEYLAVHAMGRTVRGVRPAYYTCTRRLRPRFDGERCMLPYRPVEEVDARVWKVIAELVTTPGRLEDALAVRSSESAQEGRDWEADAKAYERRLAALARAESALLARFRRGLISEAAMDEELAASAREQKMLERQLGTAKRGARRAAGDRALVAGVRATLDTLRRRLRKADPKTRQELVRALVPGYGDHVVTVGIFEVVVNVVVKAPAEERGQSSVAGSRSERLKAVEFTLVA